ncbi:trehalose-phosphatase [Candidatus Omnitrophota bacterium]
MNNYPFDAVIFDLDGVITKTARIHAQSWKKMFDEYLRLRERRDNEPFREFTLEGDYLSYVDGKPRYKGVKSFLESRGIKIPYGKYSDPEDKETICGIGNKKNKAFLEVLSESEVEVYISTISFIKELKQAGIRVGIISSSENCRYILQTAGIEELFETRVDGQVSIELKIKGKPAPDIFIIAARNLGAVPARSVVVEDAISGVQAGRYGGFGLVIGLARQDNKSSLLRKGADVAMNDISEINLDWVVRWFQRKPRPLFQCWEKARKTKDASHVAQAEGPLIHHHYSRSGKSVFLGAKKPVLFLDYDGTLTPIVERPELAVISQEMKKALETLSNKYTIAVVSGRMREDVEKLVGIKGIIYAGSHGFDILGPGIAMIEPRANQTIPLIGSIINLLSKQLGDIPGVLIEEKKFSTAVHYRLADEKYLPQIKQAVDKVTSDNPQLRMMSGKKVFEILPGIDWDKGRAVSWIMQALKISWVASSVVYIGDDTTDEDAFRVVRTRGAGILVSQSPRESAADFQLSSTEEVRRLFEELIAFTTKQMK